MKVRLMRKRYKKALTRISDKIPAAFKSRDDKRRWISEVTAKWSNERRRRDSGGVSENRQTLETHV